MGKHFFLAEAAFSAQERKKHSFGLQSLSFACNALAELPMFLV